ncbi:MAG TPA: response regulator [Polyangia bacterium]|jgi:CheY-like chemotaxis protein
MTTHRKVLLVEDNPDLAEALMETVRLLGHDVRAVGTGAAALAAAVADPPEVVLLDIGLPDLDGYEVARRLRPRLARACLVAVTGYSQPADRERARAAGFDRHLAKPVAIEALEQLLDAGLDAPPAGLLP